MITRRGFLAAIGFAGAGVVAGAAGIRLLPEDRKPTGDPVIDFGAERCIRCGRIISEARFAAAWREAEGRELHFDDIGCLVHHGDEAPPATPTRRWVHDYDTSEWIDAETATYVLSAAIKTPMAYGVVAFATPTGADQAARETDGLVLAWGSVQGELRERKTGANG